MADVGFDYLIVFNLHTCGATGDEMGSDETDIILIAWAIVDSKKNSLLEVNEVFIKPSMEPNYDGPLPCGVTTDLIRNAVSLPSALAKFNKALEQLIPSGSSYVLVTDGMLPLRQCLLPEANRKEIDLADHFYSYFDLRKGFQLCFQPSSDLDTLADIFYYLKVNLDNDQPYGSNVARAAAEVIDQMICNAYSFGEPETIQKEANLDASASADAVMDGCVVRLRGLPFSAGAAEVATFLSGLDLIDGGLVVCLSLQGRRNGEALACFTDPAFTDLAIARHKHHMGRRYVEVYRVAPEEFLDHIGVAGDATVPHGIVRMQGLPFKATGEDIVDWFGDVAKVSGGKNGVLISRYGDGKATGDAFVLFSTEDEAEKALKLNRESMGSRYIILNPCPFVELKKVLNNANPRMETQVFTETLYGDKQKVVQSSPPNCVKLTGLPYSANADDVVNFFDDLADDIKTSGIHMVLNTQGKPTGDCYVEMDSVEAAESACKQLDHKYMNNRYIEVFQCTGGEVKSALYSGSSVPRSGGRNGGPQQRDYGHGGGGFRGDGDRSRRKPYQGGWHDDDRDSGGRGSRDYHGGSSGGDRSYDRRPPKRRNYGGVTVKVRGIPFSSTEDDLVDFFHAYNVDPEDVKLGFNRDGRPSGDALVTFPSMELAKDAVRERNRKHIGTRYVELFIET